MENKRYDRSFEGKLPPANYLQTVLSSWAGISVDLQEHLQQQGGLNIIESVNAKREEERRKLHRSLGKL